MFEWIVGKLLASGVGGLVKPFIDGLLTAQKQKLDAAGSHEARIAELAQKEVDLDKREAELNAQVLIAEQGNFVTRIIRPLFGLAAVVLTWKLLVWDIAFGEWTHGSTDKLGDQAYWLLTTIVIAYMGGRTAEKIADRVAGVFKR